MTKKEEIIAAIRRHAKKLKRAPTFQELIRSDKQITRYDIHHNFGGYMKALRACGLDEPGSGRVVELRDLFLDWAGLARRLGHIPTVTEYDRHSRYSVRPLINRFGNWTRVSMGLRVYAEESGLAAEWSDVVNRAIAREREQAARAEKVKAKQPALIQPALNRSRIWTDRPTLGPPLTTEGVAHGPTNESGVVCLFGMLARRLGFVITHIQTEFPDCEALREVEKDRWQRVRIEFEYESRNFLKHCHRVEECDVIVCWIHNWPDCPLDVVELREGWEASAPHHPPRGCAGA